MLSAHCVLRPARKSTARQRSLRRRASRLSLISAVHMAVDVFFRFKYRAEGAKALWAHAERVWMGRETFLYWALSDTEIDIPWVVAEAADAPQEAGELREAVRAELIALWTKHSASLPCGQPRWMPLP